MRYATQAAGVLLLIWSVPASAQQADPAAANRALIGEGPDVNVQQSAIGTLEVGGPGAASPKLTGENLRGNLGASTQPPALNPAPAAPNSGVPNYSLQAPSFGPDLRRAAPGHRPTPGELRAVEDLILPRFRSERGGSTLQAAAIHGAEGWRYRYFNGRWWYWRSNNTWASWDGSQWRERVARN